MRRTSRGRARIFSPFRLNMTKIVNRSATRVSGDIFGMNEERYQASPFAFLRKSQERKPAAKGMPR